MGRPATDRTPRILIVRLSAVGDVIHGLPVLNALRDRFPHALLAWVVEDRAASLVRGHPALDELFTVPRHWLASPKTVWQLRRQLRTMQLDVAIDLQALAKSAVAAWLSGAPRRISFGDEKGRELSWVLNNCLVRSTSRHVVDCNLELLKPLGIDSPAVRFDFPETQPDRAAAEAIVDQAGLGSGFGIINPGAGKPSKLWPPDRYAALACWLGKSAGLPTLVVWAGDRERGWAGQIVAGSGGCAQVAPPTSLPVLAALARRARVFVGSDTGPLHLAAAVGTPCVGLYGPMPAERNGPYGPQHIAIQSPLEGARRLPRNAGPNPLMQAIDVETVCHACQQILKRPRAF